jgi:protein SCO1/2
MTTILRTAVAVALAAAVLPAARAEEADPHAHCREMARQAEAAKATAAETSVAFADAPLVDQDGREVRLRQDVIGDRLVVVDFVYTTCTTICPILSARFAALQAKLGDRLDKEVALVSISIDPVRDTPARMAAYARRWRAQAGWRFLTGRPEDVEAVLRGLGTWTADFTSHAPVVLVGDGKRGTWERHNGFPDTAAIVARLDALVAARDAVAAGGRP